MAEGTNLSEKAAAPGRWLCLRFCFVAAEFPSCRSARRSACWTAAPACRVSQKQGREEVPQRTRVWLGTLGYAGGYQALYRPRVCQQRDSDADGTAHDEQPPEESGVCPQQKRIDYRRLWQRQDEIFRQTESHAMRVGQISLFVRCDRPEGQHPR